MFFNVLMALLLESFLLYNCVRVYSFVAKRIAMTDFQRKALYTLCGFISVSMIISGSILLGNGLERTYGWMVPSLCILLSGFASQLSALISVAYPSWDAMMSGHDKRKTIHFYIAGLVVTSAIIVYVQVFC